MKGAPGREVMERVLVRKEITYKTVSNFDLRMDVYYPPDFRAGTLLPAVLFIHGDAPGEVLRGIKDSGQYVSWANW